MGNLTQCFVAGGKNGERGYCLAFNYDEEVIHMVKTNIPSQYREWHEAEKLWWVSDKYEETLKRIFPNFYALAFLQGKLF